MTIAEIIQIIISGLSLVATIAVSFSIYWLQKRHEREIEQIETRRKERELEEKAHAFLSEHSEERNYLPFCAFVSNLKRHDKHTREIYTNFCRCHYDLQNEILRQAGLNMMVPDGEEWLSKRMDLLISDIDKYQLGRNYLYDGAKYFHRGYTCYGEKEWKDLRHSNVFKLTKNNPILFQKKECSLHEYIEEYLSWRAGEYKNDYDLEPPVDYMWRIFDLKNAEEIEVCRWSMESVHDILINCYNKIHPDGKIHELLTYAPAKTFEDKYFETLFWLYYAYE